jgi:hypothetical protein
MYLPSCAKTIFVPNMYCCMFVSIVSLIFLPNTTKSLSPHPRHTTSSLSLSLSLCYCRIRRAGAPPYGRQRMCWGKILQSCVFVSVGWGGICPTREFIFCNKVVLLTITMSTAANKILELRCKRIDFLVVVLVIYVPML